MSSIGIPELLLILAILALLFGANRLPEMGRSLGKAIRGFREASRKDDARGTGADPKQAADSKQ